LCVIILLLLDLSVWFIQLRSLEKLIYRLANASHFICNAF